MSLGTLLREIGAAATIPGSSLFGSLALANVLGVPFECDAQGVGGDKETSGIGTFRSAETSGSNPIVNSVVPMPNVARASASKGRRLVGLGAAGILGSAI